MAQAQLKPQARGARLAVPGQAAASGARLRDHRHHAASKRCRRRCSPRSMKPFSTTSSFCSATSTCRRRRRSPSRAISARCRSTCSASITATKDHPEIYMLSNLDADGNPSGKHPDKGTLYWHTDGSWRERTGQATMMYSEIVPAGRRRNRIRRHVFGLRAVARRDEGADRGPARDPQFRLFAHPPPRRGRR